jgi:hypothetical protein
MSIAAQGASAGGKGLSIRKDSFVGSEAAFFGYDLSTSLRGTLGVAGATTLNAETSVVIDTDGQLKIRDQQNLANGINIASVNSANSAFRPLEFQASEYAFGIGSVTFAGRIRSLYRTDGTSESNADLTLGGNVSGDQNLWINTNTANNTTYVGAVRSGLANDSTLSLQPNGGTLAVGGNATFAGDVTVSDGYFYGLETANNQSMLLNATHASFASSMIDLRATRSGGSAYNFLMCYSSVTADPELYIRGDGTTISDGPYAGTGADYAEYFEYADGNSDAENRAGVSMVLENGLMRQAVHGEIPFAVISRNPSIVGGGDISRHKDKYLRTAYGNYDLDSEGERQLNPYWDSELEYVSREDRDEWDTAGLVGKLRVNNDSVIAPNWIKMRDINEYVSEYFTFPTDQHLYAWRDKVTEWQDERDIKIAELEARLAALEAA